MKTATQATATAAAPVSLAQAQENPLSVATERAAARNPLQLLPAGKAGGTTLNPLQMRQREPEGGEEKTVNPFGGAAAVPVQRQASGFTAAPLSAAIQMKTGGKDAVIQRFPYVRKNNKTGRTFSITQNGNDIVAVQVKGDEEDRHFCSLTFKITTFRGKPVFELSHIISDPEVGSGLGSLLVYYMAMIAEQNGFDTIDIPMAASTAIGFYKLMGWEASNEDTALLLAQQYFDGEGQNDAILDKYFHDSARVEYNSNAENHATKKRSFWGAKTQLTWASLDEREQGNRVRAQQLKFQQLPQEVQLSTLRELNYNKAVANVGMTGKTNVIKGRAFSSTMNTWSEDGPPTFEKAWDSRFNKTKLSEFPRHPGE